MGVEEVRFILSLLLDDLLTLGGISSPGSKVQKLIMSIHKVLRLTQRRSFVSSLFGFTFAAAVVTVSASQILPCPARTHKHRFADSDQEERDGERLFGMAAARGEVVKVTKRPRRWIEDKLPEVAQS